MSEPLSYIAGGDLSSDAGLCMQVSTTNTVTRATAATQVPAGILKYGVASGALAALARPGERTIGVFGGVVTPGTHAYLTTNATGELVAAVEGDRIWAKFLGKEAGADTRHIEVEVMDGTVYTGAALAAHIADAAAAHDATAISYTPTTTGDWPGDDPEEVGEALDDLAACVGDFRFLTLTPGAEGAGAANARDVVVQVTDYEGNNVAAVTRFSVIAYAAGDCALSEVGAGAQVGPTAPAAPVVAGTYDTDANGAATVRVTDSTGALVGDIQANFTPINVIGRPQGATLAFT